MNSPESLPPIHTFDTEGMNTLFTIRIHHGENRVAQQLTGNCFRQLEELEAELSRYRHDSEVSRINDMKSGESMLLADATYRCLQRALEAAAHTAGLFDPTLGERTWEKKEGEETSCDVSSPPKGKLALSPNRPEIVCEEAGREIDLGGIGKGFALDEMGITLRDLGAESALLSCGASTHLAIGGHPWPMRLPSDVESETKTIQLESKALSSSGIGQQGAHVVHPDTGASPDYSFKRVWVIGDSAALADAYSTACLIMNEDEIRSFVAARREDGVVVYVENAADNVVRRIKPAERV